MSNVASSPPTTRLPAAGPGARRRIKRLDFAGKWALVTGASAGLGEGIAHDLARRGAKLVLAARRQDRLEAVARDIESRHGAEVACVEIDLSAPGSHDELFERATAGRSINALVLNAARYWYGRFEAMPHAEIDSVVRVNVLSSIGLMRRFLPHMDANGGGGILVIASVGGLMPSPGQSLYSASKAMLLAFVKSLRFERGPDSPVVLSVASPGGMLTEMMETSPVLEHLRRIPMIDQIMMSPHEVARQSIAAFERGELTVVPGFHNRLLLGLSRLAPRNAVGKGVARAYGVGARSASDVTIPITSPQWIGSHRDE
jgi:short-subunit dehydrogenase